MPLPEGIALDAVATVVPDGVDSYNLNHPDYNVSYRRFCRDRRRGIECSGSLSAWVRTLDCASTLRRLLVSFGMNQQGSRLQSLDEIHVTLRNLPADLVDWVAEHELPLPVAPGRTPSRCGEHTLADALRTLYDTFYSAGAISNSGGFVVASKTMHCLFPDLAPMIDRRHTGLSYFHIDRPTYHPPELAEDWTAWLGEAFSRVPNPKPVGRAVGNWEWQRFLMAIGVSQRIYEQWQSQAGEPGLGAFLSLDADQAQSTGILRILDKALW